jgi:hypothetical protein
MYQSGGLLAALIALGIVFTSLSGHFFTRSNLSVVLLQVAVVGLVAVPGAMSSDQGSSIFRRLACRPLGCRLREIVKVDGQSIAVGIIVALASGLGWGLMNGVLISYLDFSPIIVTLGGFAGRVALPKQSHMTPRSSDSARSSPGWATVKSSEFLCRRSSSSRRSSSEPTSGTRCPSGGT